MFRTSKQACSVLSSRHGVDFAATERVRFAGRELRPEFSLGTTSVRPRGSPYPFETRTKKLARSSKPSRRLRLRIADRKRVCRVLHPMGVARTYQIVDERYQDQSETGDVRRSADADAAQRSRIEFAGERVDDQKRSRYRKLRKQKQHQRGDDGVCNG